MPPASFELESYSLGATEAELLSPALIVDLDRVRENLRRMQAYLGGDFDRWRPHVKTSKIPHVWRLLVEAGLRSFKCATTREAECLALVLDQTGVRGDVLVAYPHTGPALEVLRRTASGHPDLRFSLVCEEPAAVDETPGELEVFVDVDPGMNRTGVAVAETERIVATAVRAGRRFRGIHCYDGHLSGDAATRRARAFAVYAELLATTRVLESRGIAVGELVTSGTPTFRHALAFEPFASPDGPRHRVSPGTVVYHDVRSSEQEELDLVPAALVLARVVSRPLPNLVTCDAGSKSVAAEAGDPCVAVVGRPDLVPRRPSEEHLPFDVRSDRRPERGDVLYLVPRHVCPTVNLAERAVLVEGGRVLDVVEVAARAHDLRL